MAQLEQKRAPETEGVGVSESFRALQMIFCVSRLWQKFEMKKKNLQMEKKNKNEWPSVLLSNSSSTNMHQKKHKCIPIASIISVPPSSPSILHLPNEKKKMQYGGRLQT